MKTIFEGSERARNCHVSLTKYRNLNNISHYHNDHELIYVNEGKAELTVNEALYRLSVGECALIRSNDIHYIQSDESSVVSVLKAESEYFGNIFTSKRLLSPVLKSDGAIASALLEIERELSDGREYADVISDSIAARLFAEIMRSERSSAIPIL